MKMTIDFEGLCALVRDRPGTQGSGTVHVLFVDARKTKKPMGEHKPRLLVNLEDTDSRPSDIMGLPDGEQLGIWDLFGKDVRILTGVEPDKRTLNVRETRKYQKSSNLDQKIYLDEVPQYEETWNDISWIPEMARILGDGGIDPACLSSKPGPIVAARLEIAEGLLESVVEGDWEDVVWEIKPYKKQLHPYSQVCAERFRLKLASKTGIHIQLRKLGSKIASKPPKAAHSKGHQHNGKIVQDSEIILHTRRREEVRVAMANLPAHREGVRYDTKSKRLVVDHFRAYYDLSKEGRKIAWASRPILKEGAKAGDATTAVHQHGPMGVKPVLCVQVGFTNP